MLTQSRLKALLYYHPSSGDFVWLQKASCKTVVGTQAGSICPRGYIQIGIDGEKHRAHRLAALYITGAFFSEDTDHRDTVKHHNWWNNLRPASPSQNGFNVSVGNANTSGIKNIDWHKGSQRWRVSMSVKGKYREFGRFKKRSDAVDVCAQALLAFRGDFARA